MSKKIRSQLCCKELRKALQYYNPTLHLVKKDLITLNIGSLRKTSKEAHQGMERLVRAIIAEKMFRLKKFRFKKRRFSRKLVYVPICVPIRFCPFCGKQTRKDLLVNWV